MVGRRVIGLVAVFVAGACVGGLVLRAVAIRSGVDPEAQARALQRLKVDPVERSIGENQVVKASRRIEPSVVNIDTVGRVKAEDEQGASLYLDQEVRGKGSGVILSSDGYIVTNKHVVEGASRIRVTLADGKWYYARLIGKDATTDLAVVLVDASGLTPAEFGDSDRLQVGEWAIAVGNPLGLGSSVTLGVISAINRSNLQIEEGRSLDGVIQTDAPINRGNSGGGLANINGQIVGINTAILSSGPNGGSIGLGFAMPANRVRKVCAELISTGRATPPATRLGWIGVRVDPIPEPVARKLGLPRDHGALISHVLHNTPAGSAGIQEGDIFLSIDGKPIGEARDVREAISGRKLGEHATVHLVRPSLKREMDVSILVQPRPDSIPAP